MGRQSRTRKQHNIVVRQRENMERKQLLREMDIAMLKDDNTIAHVKTMHVMVIMRGLPGSGKSTIVKLIQATYHHTVVCSADDHFLVRTGTGTHYNFDPSKLSAAHQACQRKAEEACTRGVSPVVIDNTNIKKWEMMHYVKLASNYHYVIIVLQPNTPWCNDPQELARRNKHGVPADVLQAKLQSFEEVKPYYFAWFLSGGGSRHIYDTAEQYFNQCLRLIPNLAAQLRSSNPPTNGRNLYFRELYQVNSQRILHCTAFFCKGGQFKGVNEEGVPYWNWPAVQKAMGRVYALDVIGFVFTDRTCGARLRLNGRQLRLWQKDDEEGRDDPTMAGLVSKMGSLSVSGHLSEFHPTCGRGSRAHLTLGCSPSHSAVQTGLDLINVIYLEEKSTDKSYIQLKGAKARHYGESVCAVYLDSPITMTAMFSADY